MLHSKKKLINLAIKINQNIENRKKENDIKSFRKEIAYLKREIFQMTNNLKIMHRPEMELELENFIFESINLKNLINRKTNLLQSTSVHYLKIQNYNIYFKKTVFIFFI